MNLDPIYGHLQIAFMLYSSFTNMSWLVSKKLMIKQSNLIKRNFDSSNFFG